MKYSESGFSVITITKRINCVDNLINNFLRQDIKNKELVIIINNNSIGISKFNVYTDYYSNIYVYRLSEEVSLVMCLNFPINKCAYSFIAKFDDDDYYSSYYLSEAYNTFLSIDCDIVGKSKTFTYFENFNKLMIKDKGIENNYTNSVLGSTLCFKKYVFNNIKFLDITCSDDRFFNNACIKKGYKIYSTSKYNHIVFKHSNIDEHTFKSDISFLMKISKEIKSNISFDECFCLVNKK